MMNSVMTGSIKNPLQRPKVGDDLKKVMFQLIWQYYIKSKRREKGEEMHKEDAYLKENCIKRQECNFFAWTIISLHYCYRNFHEKSEI